MATHSSIIAWRIPWIERLVGIQTMGLQRFGYDGVTNTTLISTTNQSELAGEIFPYSRTQLLSLIICVLSLVTETNTNIQ